MALVRNDEKLELCRLLAVIYNFWITGWNEPWGGGVTVNDNEISSKSKFGEISIPLSFGSFLGFLLFIDVPKDNFIEDLCYLVLIILIYNISNMIMCYRYTGSLNFVKFEQKNPIKSLICRWLFIVPIILLFFYIFYDILI